MYARALEGKKKSLIIYSAISRVQVISGTSSSIGWKQSATFKQYHALAIDVTCISTATYVAVK